MVERDRNSCSSNFIKLVKLLKRRTFCLDDDT